MDILRPILDQLRKIWDRLALMPVLRWGTVTQASPVRVQLDGDLEPLLFTPQNPLGGLNVGQRVLCVEVHRRVIIIQKKDDDTGWVDVTVFAPFAPQSTAERPQVRYMGGKVSIRGGFSNTGITTNGTYNVGEIPAGFRPPVTAWGRSGTSTGASDASANVQANGTIQLRTNGSLSAYYFPAIPPWTL